MWFANSSNKNPWLEAGWRAVFARLLEVSTIPRLLFGALHIVNFVPWEDFTLKWCYTRNKVKPVIGELPLRWNRCRRAWEESSWKPDITTVRQRCGFQSGYLWGLLCPGWDLVSIRTTHCNQFWIPVRKRWNSLPGFGMKCCLKWSILQSCLEFLHLTLDSLAPLKGKMVNPRMFVPQYNAEM